MDKLTLFDYCSECGRDFKNSTSVQVVGCGLRESIGRNDIIAGFSRLTPYLTVTGDSTMTAIKMYELHEKLHNPYNYARVQLILHEMQAFVEKKENRAASSFRKVVRLNKDELKAMVKYLLVLGFQVTHNLILEDNVTKIHDYELTILFGHEYLDKQINDFLQPIKISANNQFDKVIFSMLLSLESALCGYSGDISIDEQLSWIYGIVIGWSDDSLKEFSEKHNLTQCDIGRLKAYRDSYVFLKKELEKRANK